MNSNNPIVQFFEGQKIAHRVFKDNSNELLISFKIKAKPQASKDKIVLKLEQHFIEVWVTAPAVDQKANQAIIQILAEFFGLPPRSLEIDKGSKGKQKDVLAHFVFDRKKGPGHYVQIMQNFLS